jgi:hypothetical protein
MTPADLIGVAALITAVAELLRALTPYVLLVVN